MQAETKNENREKLIELLLDDPLVGEFIAKRLLQKATGDAQHSSRSGGDAAAAQESSEVAVSIQSPDDALNTAPAEFAKVEKNVMSLGFFTPSSKRIKEAKAKTISISTKVDGNRVEAKATIVPAALYGLPITADQDKYLALQKLISDLRHRQGGTVANPIAFSSAELLHLLNHADAGKKRWVKGQGPVSCLRPRGQFRQRD